MHARADSDEGHWLHKARIFRAECTNLEALTYISGKCCGGAWGKWRQQRSGMDKERESERYEGRGDGTGVVSG